MESDVRELPGSRTAGAVPAALPPGRSPRPAGYLVAIALVGATLADR